MTRRVSRRGTTYTQGSQATFAGYPPATRVCPGCGEPCRIGGDRALWFETVAQSKSVWHTDCRLARIRETAA